MKNNVDMVVVGGGINGVGIARDAVGRGLSVILCEKEDLASHTSSASTKLIHGGLRYLEYYEFKLVRKALQEREILLHAAPHIITPLRFVMPHVAHLRPAWLIRLGLFLYDNLSSRRILKGSRSIRFKSHVSGQPLKECFKKGFVYSDAWVDDARLVVLNAMSAHELGATILTRTQVTSAHPEGDGWHVKMTNSTGETSSVHARCLVNATGPWAGSFLKEQLNEKSNLPHHDVRLIKGSHIVTKKLFDHPYAYIFQNPDNRIIFAIPFLDEFTLIGTTDLEYKEDPNKVTINSEEITYLCDAINTYFKQAITPTDVIWSYSGVRPLIEEEDPSNPSAATRDYDLKLDFMDGKSPLLSVFGGKITTFRRLAQEAVDMLTPVLHIKKPAWTAKALLPGGDMPNNDFSAFFTDFHQKHAWLPEKLALRYGQSYGHRAEQIVLGATSLHDLGQEISPSLFEQEARYLVNHEWAQTTDDILWRRSKLGLFATPESIIRLEQWLTSYLKHKAQSTSHL